MKVFVINLKRRPDRLAQVKAALPRTWLKTAEFTTDWPGPVDGSTITGENDLIAAGISLYSGWELPASKNEWWNRPLKLGEIGCSYSHFSVWRRAHLAFEQDPNLKCVVVLEDDIHFGSTEAEREQAPEKLRETIENFGSRPWDLLYLGRVLQGGCKDFRVGSGVVEPGFSYCTYGYVLSRTGVDRLLATDFHESIIPVDEFLAACYTMHPRPDVAQLFPPVLRAYSVDPYLVFQLTKAQGGSDTETSKVWSVEK